MLCASPFPQTLSHWPGIDLSRGLVRKGPHLTGSEDSEERVEEGGHQGRSSERHCLGYPIHSGHDQHVSTRSLLEGDERGQLVTGMATGTENPDEIQGRGSGLPDSDMGTGMQPWQVQGWPWWECGGDVWVPYIVV